ncbi:hypothetical protein FHX44_11962 [Pseudonocardia hierapolitana]|uniref:DoxX-like protein n=1 Tax=Pseudonocardia hierapolitana TaxID=1128676 RepID=A0A561SJL4_9PSEU|nr:hypothetical protein [Pseudonocardia hierapolitana]TWF75078.1 hypothetical protein FHX44_11962 [Pseudonocardia hierapolitana]
MTSSPTPGAAIATQCRSPWTMRVTLGVIGLLTMTPALALVSPGQLASYGVESPDALVTTLLQHRAALQLALGAALVWAGVDPHVRVPILLAATFTKGVGVVLTLSRPEVFAASSGNIGLWFDIGCLVVLPAVAVYTVVSPRRGHTR